MRYLVAVILRAAIFALFWAAVGSWEADYLAYGPVSVVASTALSISLTPPAQPRVRQWPRRAQGIVLLTGWFLGKALLGGADVARRAARFTPDIDPVVVTAPLSLPPGHARQMALLLMNLMPGSMVQRVIGDEVELHSLSVALGPEQQWAELQLRVGRAFGA